MIEAPVFHVNGDDPEAAVRVMNLAFEFRRAFQKDVVVDLVCYRRYGHNEADEPAFTQPLMYRAIRTHRTTRELYAARLVSDGVMAQADAEALVKNWEERLERALQDSARYRPSRGDWLGGPTPKLEAAAGAAGERDGTGVELAALQEVGRALTTVPADFNLNPKIARQLKAKQKMLERAAGVDWATAEALAFGTLLIEGHGVRLSGEDSIRGTFSQRHASWFDQETEARYVPLNGIRDGQARFEVVDSPLSEFGVLGFEYGYAMEEPGVLVVWEAQFGDFANGAQVVIDQFIVAGESKWQRMNGLVLLLPHGYEGQGPEHSSARIERFLQLCAEDNMQVVHPTTPASYFHALRRQLQRAFRKPLIVMTPKSLLRHKRCVSPLEDFGPGSAFRPLLPEDASQGGPSPSRLVLCTGKVYYDLLEGRESRDSGAVHLARLEQLYPFPADELAAELERYRDCELVWCQEEPRNMGAWSFVGERIARVAERVGCRQPWPRYVGRAEAAAPATGLFSRHVERQAQLVNEALSLDAGRAGARVEA
jgi:2-oxoglutarate dehydrogenase E1 component